jgi:hypothetical protein
MSTQTQRPDTLEPITSGRRSNVLDIVEKIGFILLFVILSAALDPLVGRFKLVQVSSLNGFQGPV